MVSVAGPFDPVPIGLLIPLNVTLPPGATFVAVGDIKVKLNNGTEKLNPAKPADPIEALERYSPNSLVFVVVLLFNIITDAVSDPVTVMVTPVSVPRLVCAMDVAAFRLSSPGLW